MSKQTDSRTRNFLLAFATVAFAVVLYNSREQLYRAWLEVKEVDLRFLLLLPLIQMVSYFFISNYYRTMLKAYKKNINTFRIFATTYALNFINQILPSGGGSGTAYMIYALKDQAAPGALALVQVGRYIMASLAYVPLILASILTLALSGKLSSSVLAVSGVLLFVTLPLTSLIVVGLHNQKIVDKIILGLINFINRLTRFFTRRKTDLINHDGTRAFLDEFHKGLRLLREEDKQLIQPYLSMLLSAMAEITIVYLSFVAIGANVDIAMVVLAFAAANVIGAVSVVPGDVGVHEITIITILSIIGVEPAQAIAATLLYRVFNKLITMLIGFVAYVKLIKPLVENAKHSS